MNARCISCKRALTVGEMIPAVRLSGALIPGKYACRDWEGCYERFKKLPLDVKRISS